MLQRVAVRCGALQFVAVCAAVCAAVCVAVCCSTWCGRHQAAQYVAACCSVLQCAAVRRRVCYSACCSVLQHLVWSASIGAVASICSMVLKANVRCLDEPTRFTHPYSARICVAVVCGVASATNAAAYLYEMIRVR